MYLPSLKNTVQKNNLNTTIMKINIKTVLSCLVNLNN